MIRLRQHVALLLVTGIPAPIAEVVGVVLAGESLACVLRYPGGQQQTLPAAYVRMITNRGPAWVTMRER